MTTVYDYANLITNHIWCKIWYSYFKRFKVL